jgi:outer membrane protein assembly factor BamD (BamD/ComL family)
MPARRTNSFRTAASLALGGFLAVANSGCLVHWPWRKDPDPPIDNIVLRGQTRPDLDNSPAKISGDLGKAHELFRQNDWPHAEDQFHKIAENTKNSPSVAEEARYYEAECLRLRGKLPSACDTYSKMLHDFPSGAYKEQAVRRMYDIAVLWLKPTDEEMAQYKEKQAGKRSIVMPALLSVHFEKSMPIFDAEGRALQALETVHYSDITGPLADKALFLCGYIKFYREDYKEADHYFTQLIEMHKESSMVPQALELAVICKTLANGGPDYDGRKVVEARQLIDTALRAYPQFSGDKEKNEFLTRQMYGVLAQQAEKDIRQAQFYEQTKHPGSAYFKYELVRRRYPDTKYAAYATEQMERLRSDLEKEQTSDAQASGVTGFLNDTHRWWNRMWGLETPQEKAAAESGDSAGPKSQAPAGDTPQAPPPPKPLPSGMMSGPGVR